jgi:hypothetical protein
MENHDILVKFKLQASTNVKPILPSFVLNGSFQLGLCVNSKSQTNDKRHEVIVMDIININSESQCTFHDVIIHILVQNDESSGNCYQIFSMK